MTDTNTEYIQCEYIASLNETANAALGIEDEQIDLHVVSCTGASEMVLYSEDGAINTVSGNKNVFCAMHGEFLAARDGWTVCDEDPSEIRNN